jgi:hypothetical protein
MSDTTNWALELLKVAPGVAGLVWAGFLWLHRRDEKAWEEQLKAQVEKDLKAHEVALERRLRNETRSADLLRPLLVAAFGAKQPIFQYAGNPQVAQCYVEAHRAMIELRTAAALAPPVVKAAGVLRAYEAAYKAATRSFERKGEPAPETMKAMLEQLESAETQLNEMVERWNAHIWD